MSFLRRAWAEVDVSAVVGNFKLIKEYARTPVYAVVKADAYGHGASVCAGALERAGADGFAVSNIEEAEELRRSGIHTPILILGYTPADCAARLSYGDIAQCVYSLDYARELDECSRACKVRPKVHLKLDTGMGRIGFDVTTDNATAIGEMAEVLRMKNLDCEGIFTHFAVADGAGEDERDYTKLQHARFFETKGALENMTGHRFRQVHCANSAASVTLDGEKGSFVRAGIILYGLSPSGEVPHVDGIRPAMSFYSVVSMVKKIKAGSHVSYGRTYTADKDRIIATVSAGYADGVPRLLSNKGEVIVRGQRAKITGRVCMDQFCIDVTDIEGVSMGDRVTIFGEGLSADEVAAHAETINYEIICGVSKRTQRIYKGK